MFSDSDVDKIRLGPVESKARSPPSSTPDVLELTSTWEPSAPPCTGTRRSGNDSRSLAANSPSSSAVSRLPPASSAVHHVNYPPDRCPLPGPITSSQTSSSQARATPITISAACHRLTRGFGSEVVVVEVKGTTSGRTRCVKQMARGVEQVLVPARIRGVKMRRIVIGTELRGRKLRAYAVEVAEPEEVERLRAYRVVRARDAHYPVEQPDLQISPRGLSLTVGRIRSASSKPRLVRCKTSVQSLPWNSVRWICIERR
jgi:hypothetical protein